MDLGGSELTRPLKPAPYFWKLEAKLAATSITHPNVRLNILGKSRPGFEQGNKKHDICGFAPSILIFTVFEYHREYYTNLIYNMTFYIFLLTVSLNLE